MATNIEALTFFRINIAEIKKQGKEWGLSEEEVDKCIDKAIKEDLRADLKKRRTVSSCCGAVVGVAVKALLAIALFICLFYAVTIIHEPTGTYVDSIMNQRMYDVFRIVRLVTLPLHQVFHFTAYYDSECMIENPLFEVPEMPCSFCKKAKRLLDIPKNISFTNFYRLDKPIVYRGKSKHNVTFEDLIEMYRKQPAMFDSSVYSFISTDSSVRTLGEFFQDGMFDRIKESDGFHAEWVTRRLSAAYAIRQLYRRPNFIPKRAEVFLEKTLIIDGRNAPSAKVPTTGEYGGTWLVQSYGSRMVSVDAPANCDEECLSFNVTLNAGDILYYDSAGWIASLMPTENDASIIFKGIFTIN